MDSRGVISVAVVDDHPSILTAVRIWVESADPPMKLVAAGESVGTVWQGPGADADVIVLDLEPRIGDLLYDDLQRLVNAGRRVVVYTHLQEQEVALACLDRGASTVLKKQEGDAHLIEAIRAAANSESFVPPSLAGAFIADRRAGRPKLTAREIEVLRAWLYCDSKKIAAKRLGLSEHTVIRHIDRVRIKYADCGRPAKTKSDLVQHALEDGLITFDELKEARSEPEE